MKHDISEQSTRVEIVHLADSTSLVCVFYEAIVRIAGQLCKLKIGRTQRGNTSYDFGRITHPGGAVLASLGSQTLQTELPPADMESARAWKTPHRFVADINVLCHAAEVNVSQQIEAAMPPADPKHAGIGKAAVDMHRRMQGCLKDLSDGTVARGPAQEPAGAVPTPTPEAAAPSPAEPVQARQAGVYTDTPPTAGDVSVTVSPACGKSTRTLPPEVGEILVAFAAERGITPMDGNVMLTPQPFAVPLVTIACGSC